MKNKLWRCLPALLLAGAAQAAEPQMLELNLSVQSYNWQAWLDIRLVNRSKAPLKVLHALATEEEMYGKLFDLRDARTGQPLEYQGIMVKRGPLTEEDYLTLAPGESRSNRIDLTRAYIFKEGRHSYTLGYTGHYLKDGKEQPLSAGPVRFEHTGR